MGSKKNVFIIGATNRPDIIDPAILRFVFNKSYVIKGNLTQAGVVIKLEIVLRFYHLFLEVS